LFLRQRKKETDKVPALVYAPAAGFSRTSPILILHGWCSSLSIYTKKS